MKSFNIVLLTVVSQLLLLSGTGMAAELKTIRVSDQGQVYEIPLEGWDFKRHCGSAWCPVQDIGILALLSQARDGYKQTLAPDLYPHQDLSRSLSKLMTASQYKQGLNQFDQALTNVAGSYIGTALRTAAGDPTASVNIVTGAIATTAAAGSEMGRAEALGVGLYFGKVAEISAKKAADFQNRYFIQSPVGWSQTKSIPLSELKEAAGHAHKALRLSAPAGALMTKVTYRDGWDTFSSFLRNTYYAATPGGYGDVLSTMDSMGSVGEGAILSVQALKAFDRAINTGFGNPFETDIAIYREQVIACSGLKEEPRQAEQPQSRQTPTPARSWTEPVTGMEFVWVPGGCFQMGSPASEESRYIEEAQHEVCVDGFLIGKYEVTQGQWWEIMGSNPSCFKNGDNYPVERVSWDDAQDYIRKLGLRSGKSFRLPTEAEWEYAARAGTTTPFAFGRTITPDQVNYDGKYPYGNAPKGLYRKKTTPVGSFKANVFGLHDMHGNVWEWCQDRYGEDYYRNSPRSNPQGPASGSSRVIRGGSWDINAKICRSASRNGIRPRIHGYDLGFRLVLSAGQ
ncbi:MAG: formylglycine-generating enzyme family protein [Syntrophotaleaceae bacterium]